MTKETMFYKLNRVEGGIYLDKRSAVPIFPKIETKTKLRHRSQ
jgi:hypothetical protein